MKANDVLKTYAIFYVSENDEFDTAKKLDMLKFIEQADEMMLMDLFENDEIEAPFSLLDEVEDVEEKEVTTLLGEADIIMKEADLFTEVSSAADLIKDLLGKKTSLAWKAKKMAPGGTKQAVYDKIGAIEDKIASLKSQAGKAVSSAGKAVKGATDDAGKVIEKGVKTAHKAAGQAAETVKDVAASAGEKVAGAAGKAAEFAQSQPGVVGAAVGAAAALTAGIMAYRRFFSKAAQSCKTAPDRKTCLAQYKMKAKQAQIAAINSGKAKCAKTNKPEQCRAKIDAKISGLKAKMRG